MLSRAQRTMPTFSVPAIPMAADPQEVFGAVTWDAPADGNEDGTRGQRRTALGLKLSGKNGQNPLLGEVCLLTTGGLISVRRFDGYLVSHSITSTACFTMDSGIVTPRALAAFRLTAMSTRVGPSTGRSPGFAPLRILSTNPAARR